MGSRWPSVFLRSTCQGCGWRTIQTKTVRYRNHHMVSGNLKSWSDCRNSLMVLTLLIKQTCSSAVYDWQVIWCHWSSVFLVFWSPGHASLFQACMLVFYPDFTSSSEASSSVSDVVIVLDTSESMRGDAMINTRRIALQVLNSLDRSTKINIISFGTG